MNILLIHNSLKLYNGSDAHVLFLKKNLPDFHVEATLMAIRFENRLFVTETFEGEQCSFSRYQELEDHIIGFCHKKAIDLIHLHDIFQLELIRTLSKKIPLVYTLHNAHLSCLSGVKFLLNSNKICTNKVSYKCLLNAYLEKCAGTRHPLKLWERYSSKKEEIKELSFLYRAIISPSKSVKNESIQHGIPESLIHHLPYPIRIDKDKFTRKTNQLNILFSGRLDESKGVLLLAEIFQKVRSQHPDVILNIAGDGHLKESLQKQFKKKDLIQNTNFVGWLNQKELYQLYTDADMIIIPSVYPDNFPIVCLEAMAFGKPVLTFDLGGLPELIKDGDNGFVIPPLDIMAMSQKINWLIEHQSEREKMGQTAYAIYRNNYTPEVIIPQLIKLYQNTIQS